MLQLGKTLRGMMAVGVILWFILLLVMPIYGLLRPWPQAEESLRQENIVGFPLMIGGGSEYERGSNNTGEYWRSERYRSYIVVPASFRRLEFFSYSERGGADPDGIQKQIVRGPLSLVFGLWMASGVFTGWQVRRWRMSKNLPKC
jgi:hypothetical protein